MKQSDIFSIVIIAVVGTLASYFAVNAFLDNPDNASATITTIQAISPELAVPDSELFNPNAINPTVEVMIDGCKDLDQNGIIDYQELVACDKITPETPAENTEQDQDEDQGTQTYDPTQLQTQNQNQNPDQNQDQTQNTQNQGNQGNNQIQGNQQTQQEGQ